MLAGDVGHSRNVFGLYIEVALLGSNSRNQVLCSRGNKHERNPTRCRILRYLDDPCTPLFYYINLYMYVCMYVCMFVCMFVCMHVCM